MILKIETVIKGLTAIAINFSLEASEPYQDLIFQQLKSKEITTEEFNQVVNNILNNEETFYAKMPPVAVFVKLAGKQELTIEQQASNEVERILDQAGYAISVLFDNEYSNATVAKYGGMWKIYWDLNGYDNYNKKERNWLKKELVEIWLTCQSDNNRKSTPSIVEGNIDNIKFIGDNKKCQQMIDSKTKEIEKPVEAVDIIAQNIKLNKEENFDFNKAKQQAEDACKPST